MNRIPNFLLFSILCILPFGVFLRFTVFQNVAVSVLDVLVFGLDVIVVISYKKTLAKYKQITRALLLFIVFALLGFLLGPHLPLIQVVTSASYLVRFVGYFLLVFVFAFVSVPTQKKLLYALGVSGFVFAIFGLMQYAWYPNLVNLSYLGWDDHLYRVFSTFLDPNFSGVFLGLSLILMVYLWQISQKKARMLICSMVVITAAAFLLTYSRSSYISFVVGICTFFLVTGQRKILFIALVLFTLGVFIIPKNLSSEGVHLFRDASVFARSNEYAKAITIFKKNPVFGTGFDSYRYQHFKKLPKIEVAVEDHSGAGVPNSYLLVLATTGVVGLLSFFYLGFTLMYALVHSLQKKSNRAYLALVAASFMIVLVDSLFDNVIFYPFILAWLMIISGMALVQKSRGR